MSYVRSGPGYLCVGSGDLTSAGNWTAIQAQESAADLGLQHAHKTGAFSGVQVASGIVGLPSEPTMRLQLRDQDIAILKSLIRGVTDTNSTLGLPDSITFEQAANIKTICFIPLDEAGDGEDAAHGIWFPKALITPGGLRNMRVEGPGDVGLSYNVEIQGLLDDGGTVPAGHRCGSIGSGDDALGVVGVTLPTLSTAAV